jgi:hypothetical protein
MAFSKLPAYASRMLAICASTSWKLAGAGEFTGDENTYGFYFPPSLLNTITILSDILG